MLNPKEIRVLVVDDEALTAQAVATNFEVFGFQVEKVDSVAAGTEILQKMKIDLILMDWHMPGKGGDKFLKSVRQKDWAHPSVFIMSGDFSVDIEYVFAQGADGFLLKPFDASVTRDLIQHSCLSLKQRWMAPFRKDATRNLSAQVQDISAVKQAVQFGRGGFFVKESGALPDVEDILAFDIAVLGDSLGRKVSGIGIVRWVREASGAKPPGYGVEIRFLDDSGRDLFIAWTQAEKPIAFIPVGN